MKALTAILTEYLGQREMAEDKIRAVTASDESLTIAYPKELHGEEPRHRKVAEGLAQQLGLLTPERQLVSGKTKYGFAFVLAEKSNGQR